MLKYTMMKMTDKHAALKRLSALVFAAMLLLGMAAGAQGDALKPDDVTSADKSITLHKQAERIAPDEWEVTVSANVNQIEVETPKLEVVYVLDVSGTMLFCTDEEKHNSREVHANYICGEHIHSLDCYTETCTSNDNPTHYTKNGNYWIHTQAAGATECRFINSAWKYPGCGSEHVHTKNCCTCGTDACMIHPTQSQSCTVNGEALPNRFEGAVEAIAQLSGKLTNATEKYVVFSNKNSAREVGSIGELRNIQPGGYTYMMEGVNLGCSLFGNEESEKILVILTDGQSDDKYGSATFDNFAQNGGIVFTIGFNHKDEKLAALAKNGGRYYQASNLGALTNAFDDIASKITAMVVDPMGPKVDFDISDYEPASGNLTASGDTLFWTPEEDQELSGKVVEYSYKVKLNENADLAVGMHEGIPLNNPTTFRYSITSGDQTHEYTLNFPIPEATYARSSVMVQWQNENGEDIQAPTDVETIFSDYTWTQEDGLHEIYTPAFETDYVTITEEIPLADGSRYQYVDTTYTADGTALSGVEDVDASQPVAYVITHNYRLVQPGELVIEGTKYIDGATFDRVSDDKGNRGALTYTFELKSMGNGENPLPEDANGGKLTLEITPQSGNSAAISFGTIRFTEPGTYEYQIIETPFSKNTHRVHCDETVYTLVVTVDENMQVTTKLTAKLGETTSDAQSIVFRNVYPTTGALKITKRVEDPTNQKADFTFHITTDNATFRDDMKNWAAKHSGTFDETVGALVVQTGELTPVSGAAEKTITLSDFPTGTFTVTEIGADDYTVTYQVNGGTASEQAAAVTVLEDEETAVTVTNTYVPKVTEAAVRKVWIGNEQAIPESLTVELLKNNKSSGMTIVLFEDNDWSGAYDSLKVVEENGDPIVYSWREVNAPAYYSLTDVTVDGTLTTLTNTYTPAPVFAGIAVRKTLEGRTLNVGEFSFELKDAAGEVLQTKQNDATGNVTFDEIEYKAAGTYAYTITEVNNGLGGVTYDNRTVTATVTVTDNHQGVLEAEVSYKDGKDFENTYKAAPASAILAVSKRLDGRALNAGEFSFELKDEAGKVLQTKMNAADGSVSFDAIQYETVGTYEYTITEVNNGLGGVTYDGHTVTVTVTVTDNQQGELAATVAYEGSTEFVNNYKAASTSASLAVSKKLNGRALEADEFSFKLFELKDGTSTELKTAKNAVDGTVTFEAIQYDKAGTYEYTITEVKGNLGGVTYDEHAVKATVTVTDNQQGALAATVAYEGSTEFVNTYTAKPITASLAVSKKLDGRMLKAEEFSFELKGETGSVLQTKKNAADGSVSFDAIQYDKAGTYEYTITEVKGNLGGVTYSDHTAKATVTVWDDLQGALVASIAYEGGTEFVNTYVAEPTTASLAVSKKLNGRDLKADEFSFELKDETGKVVQTKQNAANGSVNFDAIQYDKTGTYKYTITEKAGSLGGVTYDGHTVKATVTVTDNLQGALAASVAYDGSTEFVNAYAAESASASLAVSKKLDGRALNAGEFSFELKDEAGKVLQTKQNAADGSVSFDAIQYETVGTYKYTITEVNNGLGGVTYDGHTVTVTVTVTDNQQGALVTAVAYEGGTEFVNNYKAASTSVSLTVSKKLNGRELNVGEFSFELKDEAGTVVQTATNAADGGVSFRAIQYDKAGTYEYTITEKAGSLGGVTYDGHTVKATVTVTDNLRGELAAAVTYDGSTEFVNAYTARPTTASLAVSKRLDGRTLNAGEFSFELKDEAGTVVKTATNAADGSVSFDAIQYDKAGTYKYTITEVKGTLGGVTYDEHTVKAIVTVTDDLQGALSANAAYEGETVFTNVFRASSQVSFNALKTLTGRDLEAGLFSFELKTEDGTLLQTKTNDAEGHVAFDALTFTEQDIGKTYCYTISEVAGSDVAYTYDDMVYEITLSVALAQDGTLKIDVSGIPERGMVFKNTYDNDGTLTITKTISPCLEAMAKDQFVFEVKADEAWTGEVSYTIGETAYTAALTDNGFMTERVKHEEVVTIEHVPAGTYTITEYSVTDNAYTYIATYSGDADSNGKVTVVREQTAAVQAINEPELGILKITKTHDGHDVPDDAEFLVADAEGNVIASVYYSAFKDGAYTLENLKPGTYTVTEAKGSADVEHYTLKAQGNGQTVVVEADKIADAKIHNVYTRNMGALVISKTVEGMESELTFAMTVCFYDEEGEELTGEFAYTGDLEGTLASGGVIRLGHDQSIAFDKIPTGTQYTVTEAEHTAFDAYVDGVRTNVAEGEITLEGSEAAFVNAVQMTDFTVTKIWDGGDGEISLTLYGNGEMLDPQPVCARNGDVYTYTDLPVCDAQGNFITYAAKEKYVEGFITMYLNDGDHAEESDMVYDGGRILNRAAIAVSVRKVWEGVGPDEERPPITLTLYRNGEKMDRKTPVPSEDGWYTFDNLPVNYHGKTAVYTVQEEPMKGFITMYVNNGKESTECAYNGGTIVNHRIPETGDESDMAFWAEALAASGAAWMLMQALRRRKKAN